MRVLIETVNGIDAAREMPDDEAEKRIKDKTITLVEGVIYRVAKPARKTRSDKGKARKKNTEYSTKVMTAEK